MSGENRPQVRATIARMWRGRVRAVPHSIS